MKIIRLLYFKFTLSFSICLFTSIIMFFIFSLIANLNEGYLFNIIIKLSFLNAIQILTYVPAFIFLISVILFTIFLKSKNEILIIKSYLNTKRLMIFFLPIVFLCTIIEVNKKNLSLFLEKNEGFLVNEDNLLKNKIFIDEYENTKKIIILENFDPNNMSNMKYRSYEISNEKLRSAKYSNNISLLSNSLVMNNYTQYKDNVIKNLNLQKKIKVDLKNLIDKSSFVNTNDKFLIKIDLKLINLIVFFVFFLNYVFLIFINKKFVSSKQNLIFPTLISVVILLYSFMIFNNNLSFFRQEFELLASLLVGMFFLKVYLNE